MADWAREDEIVASLVIGKGLVSRDQIDEILDEIRETRPATRLIDRLVEKGLISPDEARTVLLEKDFVKPAEGGAVPPGKPPLPALRFDPDDPAVPDDVRAALRNRENDFGKYVLIRPIARGGMAELFLAWDKELSRPVVIKFLSFSAAEDIARFKREAQMQAKLSHPNIVPIHDVGELAGRHYIVMQYIDGKTVDDVSMDLRETLRVIRDAARALHYAHARGIVHRDIKPNNLMIDREGRVWVTDFGLAKPVEAEKNPKISRSGIIVGTPQYMSPEQARGRPTDARSDVYSLGITMYELLTRTRPFAAETAIEVIMQVLNEDPPPPRRVDPGIPVDVETIILKCIEKRAQRRYATAGELADDIDRFLNDEPILGRRPSLIHRMSKVARKHRGVLLGAAIALGGILASGGLFLSGRQESRKVRQQLTRERQQEHERETAHERLFNESVPVVEDVEDLYSTGGASRYGKDGQRLLMDKIDRAVQVLTDVTQRDATFYPAVELLGRAYLQRFRLTQDVLDFERARQHLDRAIRMKPEAGQGYLDRGRLYLQLMLAHSLQGFGLYPEDSLHPHEDLRELMGAIQQDFEETLRRSPRDQDRLWLEAVMPLVRGDYAAAVRSLGELAELQSNNGDLWLLKAAAHERLRDPASARACLDRAKKLLPFSKAGFVQEARQAMAQKDWERVEEAARELALIDRGDPVGPLVRCLMHFKRNRTPVLFVEFLAAEPIEPCSLTGRALRGFLRLRLGRPRAAVVDLTNAMAMARDAGLRAHLELLRAQAWSAAKEVAAAIEDAGEAILALSSDPHAYYVRGEIYFEARRFEECVRDLDTVLTLSAAGELHDRAQELRARLKR